MTIPCALLLFALLATLAASVPKISEEDYAGMDPAFATYTRANLAWRAVEEPMTYDEGFHISEAQVDAVFKFLDMEPNFDAATEKDLGMGLIRGALSLPLDPSAGDLEAIAEELGPAGAKLLKEIYEEQAADAAPDL